MTMSVTTQLSAQLAPVQKVPLAEHNKPNATNQKTISMVLRMALAFRDAHFLKRCLWVVRSW